MCLWHAFAVNTEARQCQKLQHAQEGHNLNWSPDFEDGGKLGTATSLNTILICLSEQDEVNEWFAVQIMQIMKPRSVFQSKHAFMH